MLEEFFLKPRKEKIYSHVSLVIELRVNKSIKI